ncbi:hypothetical protein BN12_60020 [Nostocoides japonicum T1-X7]|uniref:Uncharacterized protein n=1 Tax=Nostocoides japonicum T1-X7 TaxID=1194083 RepID=A0A077M6L2_9MICO|nr:hypothetical protein [Tetrasphaera japonica]CCH79814.1 hypothetical protein BN12_60020 [Tetrasphaera japonica T1-X7]
MKREQLAHILRAAANVAHDDHVIVVSSQAILGSFDEDELPEPAHASIEADVFFAEDTDLTKSDMVDGALGEDSPFQEMYGYYAQGVDATTAILPRGGGTGWCASPRSPHMAPWPVPRTPRSGPFQTRRRAHEGSRVRVVSARRRPGTHRRLA